MGEGLSVHPAPSLQHTWMDFGQTDPAPNPDFWKVSGCLGCGGAEARGRGLRLLLMAFLPQEVPPEGATPQSQSDEGPPSSALGSPGMR